jgi:hypothetical protein
MAEFIVVTEVENDRQILINTDEIQRVSQVVDGNGVPTTYMTYRGYSTRIRENVSQVTMLLAAPFGRQYPPINGFGGYYSAGYPNGLIG